MSIAQQLFVVFFAIFWGTSSNAWPRWKPFHWPLSLRYGNVRRRIAVSMLFLNVYPIIYFAAVLAILNGTDTNSSAWAFSTWIREVIRGVVPAFAIFGLYRIWLGVIEFRAGWFYLTAELLPDSLVGIEPTSEALHIDRRWWWGNVLFGVLYLAGSFLTALLVGSA